MARGNLYGALVLVIGGMVAAAAIINQPPPATLPVAIIPTVIIPTVILPTVIIPTVQIGQEAAAVTASPVIKDFGSYRIEETAYGDLMLYEQHITHYATVPVQVMACPLVDCEPIARLNQGDKINVDGVIDGVEVQPGNKVWYRTQIAGYQVYVYSGNFALVPVE